MAGLKGVVRRVLGQRWVFTLAYWNRRTPWDTNISPPELVRVVEGAGPEHLPPGRALDLVCGTGTNSLYLAHHGWQATGIDFIPAAIAQARAKQRQAGPLAGAVTFLRGDVTRLDALGLRPGYHLIFDLGCFHGIPAAGRARYVTGIARLAAPGARLLLYALGPTALAGRPIGLTRDAVVSAFALNWSLERVEQGNNPDGRSAAWFWLRLRDPSSATIPAETTR